MLVPLLAGAVAAVAAALAVGGWPGLPAPGGPAAVADYALIGIPVLLLGAAATRPPSDLAGGRLASVPLRADTPYELLKDVPTISVICRGSRASVDVLTNG